MSGVELSQIFAATMQVDRATRDAGESALMQLSQDAQLPLMLLHFASSSDTFNGLATKQVKLAAAIRLRNVISKSDWNRVAYFTEDVKTQVRASIIPLACAAHVDEHVRRLLLSTVESIVEYDYPERWGSLVPQLQQLLGSAMSSISSGSMEVCTVLRGSMQALRYCCKRYEDVTICTEKEIDAFATQFMGSLVELCQTLLRMITSIPKAESYFMCLGHDSVVQVYHSLRLAWKCVWSLTTSRWPLCLCDVTAARTYFQLLLDSQRAVTGMLQHISVELHRAEEVPLQTFQEVAAWRFAKWLGKLVSRCLSSLGVVPKHSERRARPAAQLAFDEFVAPLTNEALAIIRWHDNGSVVATSKALILALESVELAIGHQGAYTSYLLPQAEQLLTSVLFRRLYFSAEDKELWQFNAEEYVRKLTDPRGDLFNPKLISMGVIVALCHPQQKFQSTELLSSFVNFLLQKLGELLQVQYAGGLNAATTGPCFDGCLFAISQLKKLLATEAQFPDANIEWLLLTYAAPLLQCPIGYLRARAVYTLSLFTKLEWSSPNVFQQIVQSIVPLLKDTELPVKIQTCVCLSRFIRTDAARPVITAQIGAIVEQYFNVMRLMDNDGVVRTLRKTVAFYGDALAQWAIDLCRMLVQHFAVVHQTILAQHQDIDGADESDEIVDSLMAADELVETLRTLAQSVPSGEETRETMNQMQETLAPLLTMIFSVRQGANLGFMDGALHLLTSVVG